MGRERSDSDGEETRRDGLAVQAIDPFDGSPYELTLDHARIRAMRLRGRAAIEEGAHLVEYVLQEPTAIFRGLRRDQDEPYHGAGWLCYCGLPPCSYDDSGREKNPPPMKVYLVFVNDDEVVYNWRWDQADSDDPELPHDHANRFRERLR